MSKPRRGPAAAIIIAGILFFGITMIVVSSESPPTTPRQQKTAQEVLSDRVQRACKEQFPDREDLEMSCRISTTARILLDERSSRLNEAYKNSR